MEAQSNFEGWAVVELFGHQREVGFVTTQVFGAAVLFRIDTPEIPDREFTLERPSYANLPPTNDGQKLTRWCPIGSKVRREAVPAKTKLVGPSAIYAMTPCTEKTAMMAIERLIEPPLILLELAKTKPDKMLPGETATERACGECGAAPEDEHEIGCSFGEDDGVDDEEPADEV
jgi:hypothetical protein